MERFIALFASGLAQGAIFTLVALGIVLLHKATGVVNFAQGDLVTLGGYLGVWLIAQHGWPMLPGYVAVLALMFLVGVVIERVGYAPLRERPVLTVVISTFALALFIRAALVVWQGPEARSLRSPVGTDVFRVGGAAIPHLNVVIFVVTLVVLAVLYVVFSRTQVGRQVRAMAADREAALLLGVRGKRLSVVTFGVASMLAGLAGLLLAPLLSVFPTLGFSVLLTAFAATVLGGNDRLEGVALAAFGVAMVQTMAGAYLSADYTEAYPFLILLAILIVRPEGLVRGAAGVRF